jgi:hypothetical protein
VKDHKVKRSHELYLEGSVDDVIELLRGEAEGLVDPQVVIEYYGYDGGAEYYVEGWVPMTDKEKEKVKKERADALAVIKRNKEEIEANERALLATLRKKYPS